jgi:superfamily II DNA/RNA helicase
MTDSLDDFFAGLPTASTTIPAFCTESSSDSDASERVKSFTRPDESEDSPNSPKSPDSLSGNEPEYVTPPDHSMIDYPPWVRDIGFPELEAALSKVSKADADSFRLESDVSIEDSEIPPLTTFEPFIEKNQGVAELLSGLNITFPTAVQAQTIPIAFSGRDLIVISPTGTGKTLGFLLPLFFHVLSQDRNNSGPIGLILSPTEILAHQTAVVFSEFAKCGSVSFVEVTGGGLKFRQQNGLLRGSSVVIATPGRLIWFLSEVDWRFCTFVIVDEADRIHESGFFRQLRSILDYLRPDRQTMFFGATLPQEIAELSRNSLTRPVRISVGRSGAPQSKIEHNFVKVCDQHEKLSWLINRMNRIDGFEPGLVLLFVRDKTFCEVLCESLRSTTDSIGFVHGDLERRVREETFTKFRSGQTRFLVSTEIAARGIDIPDIGTVVNVDAPESPQNYIHRIGRTARAGRSGIAFTLLTSRDSKSAADLLQHFELAGIEPPESLSDFVNAHPIDQNQKIRKRFDFNF